MKSRSTNVIEMKKLESYRLISVSIIPQADISNLRYGADKKLPPHVRYGSALYWGFLGTNDKSNWRRALCMDAIARLGLMITPEWVHYFLTGGIKQDDKTGATHMSRAYEQRFRDPVTEMGGACIPVFSAGALEVRDVRSLEPIDLDKLDAPRSGVRRDPMSNPDLLPMMADPTAGIEQQKGNSVRSKMTRALDDLDTMRKKVGRSAAKGKPAVTQADYDKYEKAALAKLSKTLDRKFASLAELQEAATEAQATFGKNSAQLPYEGYVIPAGTPMRQEININAASQATCGAIVHGMHLHALHRGTTGGRVSTGCGGYLDRVYKVMRLVPSEGWVFDCMLTITASGEKPGVTFDVQDGPGLLKQRWDAYKTMDLSQFDWTVPSVKGRGAVAAAADAEVEQPETEEEVA